MIKSIVLYGAGKRCKRICKLLKNSTIQINCIIDSNPEKWGEFIEDIPICSPEYVEERKELYICITTANHTAKQEIKRLLQEKYKYDFKNLVNYEELCLSVYEVDKGIRRWIKEYPVKLNKDKSIIFDCHNGLGLGGIEAWTLALCNDLISRGYKNTYILTKLGNYQVSKLLEKNVIYIDNDSSEYFEIREIINIILERLPCKIVTSHVNSILIAAYLVKVHFPELVEVISVIHGGHVEIYDTYNATSRCTDLYIGVSQDIKVEMMKRGIEEHRIKTMTCPFPCEKGLIRSYTLDKKEPIHIGYAGRMDGFKYSQKRMDLLLKLIEELRKRNVNFYMELAGDGPVRTIMECEVERGKLTDRVKFLGKIDRMTIPDFWKRQDICVNIADYEGRSISIIEAMGNGAVPVVTKVSGTQEDITDGMNGYLIPLQDYEKMADKIQYLAEHREQLVYMGRAAHDMIYPKSLMLEHLKFWEENVILKV